MADLSVAIVGSEPNPVGPESARVSPTHPTHCAGAAGVDGEPSGTNHPRSAALVASGDPDDCAAFGERKGERQMSDRELPYDWVRCRP
jgi:hypothetical protein